MTLNSEASTRILAIGAVLIAIITIQASAAFAHQLFPMLGPQGTTAVRQLFSAIALSLVFRPWRFDWKQIKPLNLLLYGAIIGAMNLIFYMAIDRIPLGVAVAIEFTGPLAVAFLNSRRPIDFVWIACVLGGLYWLLPIQELITGLNGGLDLLGCLYALIAGLCWAAYIIIGGRLGREMDSGLAVTLGMWISCLITLPVGLYVSGLKMFSPDLLMIGILLAIFASAIPYGLEMIALKHIPPQTFSLMMSLEPAAAALFGLILLHESLALPQILAIGLVVIASAGSSLNRPTP